MDGITVFKAKIHTFPLSIGLPNILAALLLSLDAIKQTNKQTSNREADWQTALALSMYVDRQTAEVRN